MEHYHDEYSLPESMVKKFNSYWEKPEIYEFRSQIKEINGNWIRLNKSYFYPESGGQASDRGAIYFQKEKKEIELKVIDVQLKDGENWIKYLLGNEKEGNELQEGYMINAVIDKDRRKNLSLNHSSQHLVSAVLWEEFGYETTRAEIKHNEAQIDVNKSINLEDLNIAILKIHELIIENHPITARYYENIKNIPTHIRGKIEKQQIYRLVAIGKYDLNPCGGTHVNSTGIIDSIFISKIRGKKIKFQSGHQAKLSYANFGVDLIKMSRKLNSPLNGLLRNLDELIAVKNAAETNLKNLENELVAIQIQNKNLKNLNQYQYAIIKVSSINRACILEELGELDDKQIVFAYSPNGMFLMTSGSSDLLDHIMKELRKNGIKGGGKNNIVGKLSDINDQEKKIEKLIITGLSNC